MAANPAAMKPIEFFEDITAGNLFWRLRRGDCDKPIRVAVTAKRLIAT